MIKLDFHLELALREVCLGIVWPGICARPVLFPNAKNCDPSSKLEDACLLLFGPFDVDSLPIRWRWFSGSFT